MGWQFRREFVLKDTANDEYEILIQTDDESEMCVGWGYSLGTDENGVKHAVLNAGAYAAEPMDGRPLGVQVVVAETDSTSAVTTWQVWAIFAKQVID